MGRVPLPSYEQLKLMAKDEETLDRFIHGIVFNPPRQSLWARWRTRKLRAEALAAEVRVWEA